MRPRRRRKREKGIFLYIPYRMRTGKWKADRTDLLSWTDKSWPWGGEKVFIFSKRARSSQDALLFEGGGRVPTLASFKKPLGGIPVQGFSSPCCFVPSIRSLFVLLFFFGRIIRIMSGRRKVARGLLLLNPQGLPKYFSCCNFPSFLIAADLFSSFLLVRVTVLVSLSSTSGKFRNLSHHFVAKSLSGNRKWGENGGRKRSLHFSVKWGSFFSKEPLPSIFQTKMPPANVSGREKGQSKASSTFVEISSLWRRRRSARGVPKQKDFDLSRDE